MLKIMARALLAAAALYGGAARALVIDGRSSIAYVEEAKRSDPRIAVSVGEEPDTIEEAYEPFLIMEGYLERTPKGRVATGLAKGLFTAAGDGLRP